MSLYKDYPVGGQCKLKNVVYQAVVEESVSKKVETYTGLTYRSFKERHKEHMDDLADPAARSSSRLAGHVWGLKDKGLDFDISWRILAKAQPFNPVTRKCNLCLKEIHFIMFGRGTSTLNKRQEIFQHM